MTNEQKIGFKKEHDRIWNSVVENEVLLGNLYARWQDEKEYEDFNDYAKVIRETFSDLKIVKVNKRPFGFTVSTEYPVSVQVKVTMRSISTAVIQ